MSSLKRVLSPKRHKWIVENPDKVEKLKKIEDAVITILEAIGEDPDREGLIDTPFRVAKMYLNEITQGYNVNLVDILKSAKFTTECDEMVIVKDIPFYSLCEHHILPFFGKAHIAYIPNEFKSNIVGLSKIARVVEMASKKLNLQEGLTNDIANALEEALEPLGVAVVLEGYEHTCMTMRGVEKPGTKTITSKLKGVFKEDSKVRAEFYSIINGGR